MRKIITLLTFFVALTILFTGCTKPKGTFGNDNYTEYSMTTTWCGYNMNVGPYGYEEYEVDAGGGTASVYANGYGQWGTLYVDIPEDGYGGVEMYWNKSTKSSEPEKGLKKKTERGVTTKKVN